MWPRFARPARLSAAVLAGIALAAGCSSPAPLPALALAVVAAAGRRWLVVAVALGLLAEWGRPPQRPPRAALPIAVSGELAGPWRQTTEGWLAWMRTRHYRQGRRVELWSQRVTLLLPGAPAPPPGDELRVRGMLTRAPALANRPQLPAGAWRLRLKSRHFLEVAPEGRLDLAGRLARGARRRIGGALAAAGAGPGTRLARALILGDPSRLSPALRRGLRAAGLAHLVALSGLHVGLLMGICLLAGALLPRGAGALLAVVLATGFLLVAGARPALLRATLMGAGVAGALSLGRRPHPPTLLAVLAMLLAAGDTALLDDLGYRLTCSATAGILWLSPRFAARWPALPRGLRRPLAVTAAAQIGSLPWALPAFRLVTPLAPCWNLVAVPWTAVALICCLVWGVVALVDPSRAGSAVAVLDAVALPFAAVAEASPRLTRPLPLVVPWWVATALAVGLTLLLLRPRRRWPLGAAALVLAAVLRPSPPGLELQVLDVGQGEAVLLRDREAAILIDGGGWRHGDLGGRVLVPALAAAGVRRLQAVVLSHPDLDHCRGLADLLGYLPVAEVWTAPGWGDSECARELLTSGARPRLLWAGERAAVGRWRLRALHPPAGDRGGGNDRSLVLAAAAPGLRLLLTGDLEAVGERRLVRRWPTTTLAADLLKVAHHGSRSSTTSRLLGAVEPRLALISCGRGNRYGHPAGEVVERLAAAGTRLLRTDRSGQIVVRRQPDGGWRLELPAVPHPD